MKRPMPGLPVLIYLLFSNCNLDQIPTPPKVNTFEAQYGTIGDIEENGADVIQLSSEEYVVVGSQEIKPNLDAQAIILKFDTKGNLLSANSIPKSTQEYFDNFNSLEEDANGNIVAIGTTYNGQAESYDVCLAKFSSNLDLIFHKKLNRNAGLNEYGKDLIVESDGYILLANVLNGGNSDIWLLKLDFNGNITRQGLAATPEYDAGEAIVKSEDNKIIVVGTGQDKILVRAYSNLFDPTSLSNSYGGSGALNVGYDIARIGTEGYVIVGQKSESNNITDMYFLRIDQNLFLKMDKSYGEADSYEFGQSIEPTSDGNFILAGRQVISNNFVSTLTKVDRNGQIIWQEFYAPYGFYSVKNTKDRGFIAAGTVLNTNDGETDVYLVKTNKEGKQE